MTFMQVWVGYAVFGCLLFSAAFLWAVRNGQFHDIDEARYLALDVKSDAQPNQRDNVKVSNVDRLTVAGLLVLVLGVLAVAVVLSWLWAA